MFFSRQITSLFGDGCVSYLVEEEGNCEVLESMEYTWKDSLSLMGWGVENDGLSVIFDKVIPDFISKELPELKITLEHITTKEATAYVNEGNKNLVATITPHHLALNRNAIFNDGIRPHNYCLPILKREIHRKALLKAATSGNIKFFLGTDTAPHLTSDKESACGCAGVFNSTYCLSILAQLFDNENALPQLEGFLSKHGAKHYDLATNKEKIQLVKSSQNMIFKKYLKVNKQKIKIFEPDFSVFWTVSR